MHRIYLDYAATTPVHPEVLQAMLPYFIEKFGNPSSLHFFGRETRSAVETARENVAGLIGAAPSEIVFTSGGTESNNYALHGASYANQNKGNHIITSAVEHHAVLKPCKFLESRGFKVTYLPVDKYGMVDPQEVKKAVSDKTILVSIMHANNEIGTLMPIKEISKITREKGICFHTDAVQTVGEIKVDVNELGVDLLSLSAHKFYGPKGVGALYIRKGTRITPFILGGSQENHRRASTENVAGIAGLGKACEIAGQEMDERAAKISILRRKLVKGLQEAIEGIIFTGHPAWRLHKNAAIIVPRVEGESMLLNLDLEGIAASSGSACSSGTLGPSHVLSAIGIPPERAHGSLRFSLGKFTGEEDIDRVLEVFPKIVEKLRAMSPLKGG